uniref:WSC domain-containing protein n=1 Tax=Psilocybe cubensis TaxID=181762 RepID=A0A8H7Y1L9_PSICU
MACSGNASELCGGPIRLNIFQSNRPPPVIVQNITTGTGLWTYQGCFTDSPQARTLGTGANIPLGTTPESCAAACLAQGGFTFAGVENGHECWCDNTVHAPTQRVGDADCRQICQVNHAEYCGNANRVAVYEFSPTGKPPGPQVCLDTNLANFTLRAQFKNPPITGPSSVPLKVVAVEIVKNVVWTVLSACTTCCSEWPSISLSNSIISPHSVVVSTQQMTSTFTNDGESPNFVASVPAFAGSQAYCTMTDPTAPVGSPPILAFNGQANAFSLCTNTSANARVDLVFSPVTGHPHYTLDTCQPVNVQVIT